MGGQTWRDWTVILKPSKASRGLWEFLNNVGSAITPGLKNKQDGEVAEGKRLSCIDDLRLTPKPRWREKATVRSPVTHMHTAARTSCTTNSE